MSGPGSAEGAWVTARAVRDGSRSAVEIVEDHLARIHAGEPRLGAWLEVQADRARERARGIDRAREHGEPLGPLAGVPMALKDNLCTAWGHTTCASRILRTHVSPYTATVVSRLEEAGAVILGKTNMDEFAMGSSTENSSVGPTRNPHDPSRVAGGSSGGSAAAVSAGMAAAGLGSDTGGSVRQPAAFCGVVGMKPSYGRVSRYGLVAYGSSLDQVGTLTRDVRDAALVLGVIAGHDPLDTTCADTEVPDYVAGLEAEHPAPRIGLPRELFGDGLEAGVRARIEEAVKALESTGAVFVDVSLPHSAIHRDPHGGISSYAVACYYIVAMAEASSNLARYDGVHYGVRTTDAVSDVVDLYARTRAEHLGEEVKRRILLGTFTLSSGYYDAYYDKALRVRRLISRDFQAAFEGCDVLLCPVTPTPAFQVGEKTTDPLTMYLEDIYTVSMSLAGLPAVSVPCGTVGSLPVAFQLVGPHFGEESVLAVARRYERASRGA